MKKKIGGHRTTFCVFFDFVAIKFSKTSPKFCWADYVLVFWNPGETYYLLTSKSCIQDTDVVQSKSYINMFGLTLQFCRCINSLRSFPAGATRCDEKLRLKFSDENLRKPHQFHSIYVPNFIGISQKFVTMLNLLQISMLNLLQFV